MENAETVRLHFPLDLEGLRDQIIWMYEQTYMDSYMAYNG